MRLFRYISTVVVLTALTGISAGAKAATLKVPSQYSTIQAAIDAASNGDTVLVADGTYYVENINFKGKAITVKSENGAASTIIYGNQNSGVVTFISGEGLTSVLDGFSITNGSYGVGCWNSSSPTITNCIISGNNGWGIFCYYSSPMIENCTISGNMDGGIVCQNSSFPMVTNCTISGNDNGGIRCDSSSPTITNCIISGNTVDGIWCGSSSSPTITNCTISDNDGSGIICSSSSPTITNCTISGNSGSGIDSYNRSSPMITNCTISGNSASNDGGGVRCSNFSSPIVVNSILWGDTADGSNNEIYVSETSSITIIYSDIEGGDPDNPGSPYPGTGNIDADPSFVGNGDYHLQSDSPCIDAGTYDGAPDDDIEGVPRPQKSGIDMGAYEYCDTPQTWYKDADDDGYSDGTTLSQCARPDGYKLASELTATSGDCNDGNASIHPGATETCNGVDDDCDGQIDEGCTTNDNGDDDDDDDDDDDKKWYEPSCSAANGNRPLTLSGVVNLLILLLPLGIIAFRRRYYL